MTRGDGVPGRRRPALRLTRRGRVALRLSFILLAASVAALAATASRASDPPVGPPPTAVVRPHDTLWSIAARHAPHRDVRAVIAEIRQLNGLSGTTVHPGHRLVLPR